jgi:hypothetical protein
VADAEGRVLLDGPQLLLAQRLGVARQTLSRALHRLAASDLVRIDPSGRAITIVDEPGLRAMTETGTRRNRIARPGRPTGALTGAVPADLERNGYPSEKPAGSPIRPVGTATTTGWRSARSG